MPVQRYLCLLLRWGSQTLEVRFSERPTVSQGHSGVDSGKGQDRITRNSVAAVS